MKKCRPSIFRSNLYATFWFEQNRNKRPDLIDAVGEDSTLFETYVPHPTCLYPKSLEAVEAKIATPLPSGAPEDPQRERPQALPHLTGANPPGRLTAQGDVTAGCPTHRCECSTGPWCTIRAGARLDTTTAGTPGTTVAGSWASVARPSGWRRQGFEPLCVEIEGDR